MIHRETADVYHARRAVSASMLWETHVECPAYAYARSVFNPEPIAEDKPNRTLEFGTAVHLAALEGHLFADRVLFIDYPNYKTNAAKAQRDEAIIAGKTPLLADDYELVQKIARVLRDSDAAEYLFGDGESEVSYTWEVDGIQCKARADRLTPLGIIDLKTAVTTSASPAAFQRGIVAHGHHMRAAWYKDGLFAAQRSDWSSDRYIFVVVASRPPHLVSIYEICEAFEADDGTVYKTYEAESWGRRIYRKALDEIRAGLETGAWRGYAKSGVKIQNVGLPTWQTHRLADMEEEGEL